MHRRRDCAAQRRDVIGQRQRRDVIVQRQRRVLITARGNAPGKVQDVIRAESPIHGAGFQPSAFCSVILGLPPQAEMERAVGAAGFSRTVSEEVGPASIKKFSASSSRAGLLPAIECFAVARFGDRLSPLG